MEKTLYSKVLFPLAYFIRFPNFGAVATKLLDEQCPEYSIIYFVIFLLFRKIFIWLYRIHVSLRIVAAYSSGMAISNVFNVFIVSFFILVASIFRACLNFAFVGFESCF